MKSSAAISKIDSFNWFDIWQVSQQQSCRSTCQIWEQSIFLRQSWLGILWEVVVRHITFQWLETWRDVHSKCYTNHKLWNNSIISTKRTINIYLCKICYTMQCSIPRMQCWWSFTKSKFRPANHTICDASELRAMSHNTLSVLMTLGLGCETV